MPAARLKIKPVCAAARMYKKHINSAGIPFVFIFRTTVYPHSQFGLLKCSEYAVAVVLVAVECDARFAVQALNQFEICLQLRVVNMYHPAVIVIHSTGAELLQLSCQHSRRVRCYNILVDFQQQVLLKIAVRLLSFYIKHHRNLVAYALRQFEIVFRLHADANIAYSGQNCCFRITFRLIVRKVPAVRVGIEVSCPELRDVFTQPRALVK